MQNLDCFSHDFRTDASPGRTAIFIFSFVSGAKRWVSALAARPVEWWVECYINTVSYTHLDVYKRQSFTHAENFIGLGHALPLFLGHAVAQVLSLIHI